MSSSTKKYHVFINFRGEDTRIHFVSHLYSALRRENFDTYIDDLLEKGEEVWPALCQAIENSQIAIVVFSKDYASSKWCLEELVKILECRKNKNHRQVIIPVFYEVEPFHVRHQIESFKEAFEKHDRFVRDDYSESMREKVSKWRQALKEAADVSGWHCRSRDYKDDSQVIKKIVEDISQKIDWRHPTELDDENLVGIDKIRESLELLLSRNKQKQLWKNIKVIGILGMGGIGKTTAAKAVFSQLFPLYDTVCFFKNVNAESKRSGPTSLGDKLFVDLLKDGNPSCSLEGSNSISRRLNNKKVFIVLDDVDNLDQLDDLCRVYKYAGPDSKLIITTRNMQVLTENVDEIYEAKIKTSRESLELFCLHVFKQKIPRERYEDLSQTAVIYAGGVPLALKVLGSTLRGESTEFWDCELKKLNTRREGLDAVKNVLQVSYDGLDGTQKKIFLDIAFFFKDEEKDFVERILNACNFYATSGIKVLANKSLITISKGMRIEMHDLLQELGLNIVRCGIEDPGSRSRLRDVEDVSHVLKRKKENIIEGITLDLSHVSNLLCLSADAFNLMAHLRILKFYIPSNKTCGKVVYPKDFNEIPDNLRYLEWHGYRPKSLPTKFSAELLVEIRMPYSHVTELWQGVKDVMHLERIDLSECSQLENLPDLSKASKLKWVNLTGCRNLLDVHPSVLSLDTLQTLILDNCVKLKTLKSEKHLRSLKNLSINSCTCLKEFSLSSDLILRLDLSTTGVEKLHSSIGNLIKLESLNLEGLRLRNLPDELSFLKSLRDLRISHCTLVTDEKLCVLFEGLMDLRILYLKDCCNMSELPDNISRLSKLYELRLDGSNVERLPESIKHLQDLQILSLNFCLKLRWLPKLPPNVKELNVINCRSLVTVPTLKTFAEEMKGKEKYISFQNCTQIDEASLHSIMKGALLSARSAVFQNVFVRRYNVESHSYNYNFVKVCWPGSTIPANFKYRATHSSIPIKLPSHFKMLGIVLCAVLSPSPAIKKHGAKIYCQCYLGGVGGRKMGYATTWYYKPIWDLDSDHVYLWYDAFHFDSTVRNHEQDLSFEFYVTNALGERDVLKICTKECGVHLIFDSDLKSFIEELDLDLLSKESLAKDLGAELGIKMGS